MVTVALVLGNADRPDRFFSGGLPGQRLDHRDEQGALQEGESAGPEVVGQGPEGLGSQRHLGMKGPGTGAVEGDPAGRVGRHLVDAAHAVDGHVLDQEVLLDQAILLDQAVTGGRGGGGIGGPAGPAPSSGVDGLSSIRRVMAPPGGKGRQNTGR